MIEGGIDRPEHARELAIQRLKMKQDFKGARLMSNSRVREKAS
jgi:hypothetical protein